jgi:hypothetical protein
MNVGIGTEAALFPEKEYIMEISFAMQTVDLAEIGNKIIAILWMKSSQGQSRIQSSDSKNSNLWNRGISGAADEAVWKKELKKIQIQ